jgi:hypothetical protein
MLSNKGKVCMTPWTHSLYFIATFVRWFHKISDMNKTFIRFYYFYFIFGSNVYITILLMDCENKYVVLKYYVNICMGVNNDSLVLFVISLL